MSEDGVCRYRDHHPEIEAQIAELGRRLQVVEGDLRGREDARVEDIREYTSQLGELHEKVNAVALTLEGLRAKFVLIAGIIGGSGGVVVFILGKLWH